MIQTLVIIMGLIISGIVFLTGSKGSGLAHIEGEKESIIPIKEITSNPSRYIHKEVMVEGRLENEGRDYFTDLRLVLKDEEGNKLSVEPWLPLELPPPPPLKDKGERPAVIREYLNKRIKIKGIIKPNITRLPPYTLTVESVEVMEAVNNR